MSLNQSFISDFSEYYRWSQSTKIKYKVYKDNYVTVLGQMKVTVYKGFVDIWPRLGFPFCLTFVNFPGTFTNAGRSQISAKFKIT